MKANKLHLLIFVTISIVLFGPPTIACIYKLEKSFGKVYIDDNVTSHCY